MGDRTPEEDVNATASASPTGDAAAALHLVRPVDDPAVVARARSRSRQALFGSNVPARLGRFVLLEPIAGGAMGVVHGAYDPQLDRRVALKLLHPRQHGADRAHERMLAEARALARLDHPNVVPVHDVIELDEQIVIVMELVAGQTVAAWEHAHRRSWREIVGTYVQAARGLAAAHALGVIHRDFKPANAIVGDDGRVRVLDFGLAQLPDDDDDPRPDGERAEPLADLTATGQVIGTLAYSAPERLTGGAATVASDQFSLCVALHRALHRVPPFAGHDLGSFAASIAAGRIAHGSDRRGVPRWLTAIVDRGLAADPAARHPSIDALIAELTRERGWRRWRGAIALGLLIATSGAAFAVARDRGADPLAACEVGPTALAGVWDPSRRATVQAALDRVGTPYAREAATRVVDQLDRYAEAWRDGHRDACVAHRRGTQSAAVLDRRMLCLHRRRADLAAAVGVLGQVDVATIGKAVDVVARMPRVAACGDLEAIVAEHAPPATPTERAAVAAVRDQLSRAAALDRAGRSLEALALAREAVAGARETAYPPVEIEALLLEGKVLLERRDWSEAAPSLARAEELALAQGLWAAAVEAGARRIYVEGSSGRDLAGLLRQVAVLEPLSRSLRGDHFARPLLLNNVGVLHMARGERDDARRYFEEARTHVRGIVDPDLELVTVDHNMAMLTADPVSRAKLARAVWTRLRDRLGAAHVWTIGMLWSYGHYVVDPATAAPLITEACDLLARFHPDLVAFRTEFKLYQAFLVAELGDGDRAAALNAEVAALAAAHPDADVASLGQLAAGHVSLHGRNFQDARAQFGAVIAARSTRAEWWERGVTASARLGLGLAEAGLGDRAAAITQLDAARVTFESLIEVNEDVEHRQRLSLTLRALAAVRGERDPSDRHPWLPR